MATCFPRVDGLSTDPRVWGITHAIYDDELVLYIPEGIGLEYEYIVVHLTF